MSDDIPVSPSTGPSLPGSPQALSSVATSQPATFASTAVSGASSLSSLDPLAARIDNILFQMAHEVDADLKQLAEQLDILQTVYDRQLRRARNQPDPPEVLVQTPRPVHKLPSNAPTFNPWSKDSPSPLSYIDDLECMLMAHELPRSRWSGALASCLRGSAKKWGRRTLFRRGSSDQEEKCVPWAEARSAFITYFSEHESLAERRHHLAKQVRQLRMKNRESVAEFAERFVQACLQADIDIDNRDTLLTLEEALPAQLRRDFVRAHVGNLATTFQQAIATLKALEKVNVSHDSRDTLDNSSSTSSSKMVKLSKANASAASTSAARKHHCDYHGTCNHTTSQCRALKGKNPPAQGQVAVSAATPSNSFAKPVVQRKEPPSSVTCYHCKQVGHYANACPRRAKDAGKGTGSLNYLSRDNDDDIFDVLALSTAASSETDPHVLLTVPVKVNDHEVQAVIDTGSSVSVICQSLQRQWNLELQAATGRLHQACTSTQRIG